MKIETTGVIFVAECSVKTAKYVALTPQPITAVWKAIGREQINVCRACLDEKIRTDEWDVEGARAPVVR